MRPDQITKLQALTERLTDILIVEIDPANWPGENVDWKAIPRQEAVQLRGDRYWQKKNGAATLSVITKLYTVLSIVKHAVAVESDDEADLELEIASAEKEAERAISVAIKRSRGGNT